MRLFRGGSRVYRPISVQLNCKRNLNRSKRLFALAAGKNTRETEELTLKDLPGPHSDLEGISLAKKLISDGLKLLAFQQKTNNLIDAGKIILKSQVRNVERFGPIFRTKYTGLRVEDNVKISNPNDVASVLRSEGQIPHRPESPVMEYYRRETSKPAGLIFDNGLSWYKHRKRVNERMLQPRSVAEYEPAFNEIITEFVTRLEKLRGRHGVENEIPLLENELFKWSFESVSLLLFDERFGALEDKIKPEVEGFIGAVHNFLQTTAHIHVQPPWMNKIFPTKMYKQFSDSYDTFYEFTDKVIKRKLKEFEKQEAGQNQSENMELLKLLALNSDMTHKDLLATYVDVYFAGVDTTATAILWSLYLLANHQDKQLKLYQEISSVLKPGEIATSKSLAKLPYLKACIKEVLRMYPAFHLHRVTDQDLVLSGYKIPAGTQVMILVHAMSMSEKYFDDPCTFKPERWLWDNRKPSDGGSNVDAFASLPFGFGTRMCVGRRVSELEQYLLLTRIVQNHQLFYFGETVVRTIHGVVITPDRPVRVQFVKRQESRL
ncbi:sterol 26-hydroxylase, mitochondrial-like [Oculina patagonica]